MKTKPIIVITIFILSMGLTLSCSLLNIASAIDSPGVDATKVALEIMATSMAAEKQPEVDPTKLVLEIQSTAAAASATQQALEQQQADVRATQDSMSATQQAMAAPTSEPPAGDQATTAPTEVDMEDKIRHAKILVYEDTQNHGMWITDALDGMDVEYTHVGDRSGDFLKNLDSPVDWDLIIVGGESRTKIQGEFWDVINEKITKDKTALIAEVWYLDSLGGGKIRTVMTSCGISYQQDWDLAESIYWVQPDHPLFASPNVAMPLLNYSRYWWTNAGDLVRLSPGSTAQIVAGAFTKRTSDYGLITVCMDGRMVFQTFSNHDFHYDEVIRLWQNYVTYTLTNHFNAIE